jgi:hypothetical protein
MLRLNTKQILEKSIKSGINMKFTDFIKFNTINLNESYVDTFFHNLQSDIPIYMSETMIEYFGYKGTPKVQKELLNRIINDNFLEYKNNLYFEYNNKQYIEFRNKKSEILSPLSSGDNNLDKLYPPALTTRGKTNTKHILISPKLFKEMLMLCNTEKGKQVRRYYLDIVDVMELYIQYQNKLTINTLEQKLDNISLQLTTTNTQLATTNTQLIEERKCADEERKKSDERFNKLLDIAEDSKEEILEKIVELEELHIDLGNVVNDRVSTKRVPTDKYNYLVILKDAADDEVPYYILRTQEKSVNGRIALLKKKYTTINEIFRIYTPNATKAWISICNKYSANILKSATPNWFNITELSEAEFKANILDMDMIERKNPKYI